MTEKSIKRRGALILFLIILTSVVLDQITKFHAQEKLMVWSGESDPTAYLGRRYLLWSTGLEGVSTFENFYLSLSTNYVRNVGAAWGALSGLPEHIRVPFFYGVTAVAVVIIGLYMRATPPSHRLAIYALSMVLSGAIGNFIDRIKFGYVIDWIDVRWNILGWSYDFPNFNVADSAITLGVILLMWDTLILESKRKKPSS